ncbi:MAG: DUF481 domain-containing protein [Acidiferrobacter sp.]
MPGNRRSRVHRLVLSLVLALAGVASAYASKGLAAPKHSLSGQAGLGYAAATGTSNTRTLDTRDRVRYGQGLWRFTGRLSYDYASSLGLVSANRLVVNLKGAHYFSGEKENFFLLALRYDRNPFDGYRHYQVESVGAGHRFLRHGSMRFKVDGGVGYRQNYYLMGGHENAPMVRLGADYRWRFGKKTIFSQRLTVLATTTGTLLTSTTGLTAPISGNFALKVSEVVDHYTSAPAGFVPTSTFTTLNLIYSFP